MLRNTALEPMPFPAEWGSLIEGESIKKSRRIITLEELGQGQRNSYLTSLAGTMRRRGMGESAIYSALQAENKDRCKPPLSESEIWTIAQSVSRYEPAEDPRAAEPKADFDYIEFAPSFLAVEDPPIRYLVGELMPEAVIALDHGEPRTRKSWFEQEIAIALATGTNAFGMDRFKILEPVPVLYSSQEDAAQLVRMRAKAILKARGINQFPETLAFSIHKGITFESHEWREALIRDTIRHNFRLLIFDPIRRYAQNADKGPSEVNEITTYLRRLVVETGATVKIVHHDVKPKADNRDDRRRSHKASGGDWFAASECPVSFEIAGENQTLVIPEDFKLSISPEPFTFRLETDDPMSPTWARLIGETASADDAKTLALTAKILEYLRENSTGATQSAIAKYCRARKDDVIASLNSLLKTGDADCYGGGGRGKKQTWFLVKNEQEK